MTVCNSFFRCCFLGRGRERMVLVHGNVHRYSNQLSSFNVFFHKLRHRRPVWTSGSTFSLWWWPSTFTAWPGRLWSLHTWRYPKAAWIQFWAACSWWPFLSMGLEQMTSGVPFQPEPFCGSVILFLTLYAENCFLLSSPCSQFLLPTYCHMNYPFINKAEGEKGYRRSILIWINVM